jgi:Ni/Fe-hydrogenase 1 B-type cytochrome subunit
MTLIEPTNQDLKKTKKGKKYSSSLRLWHWTSALVIIGLLLTVLINSTLLKNKNSAPVIKKELQKAGAKVTNDQAIKAAHALSGEIWDVHIYLGYALTALLLFRLVLEFFQLTDQKFIRTFKTAWHNLSQTKMERETAKHKLVVQTIYTAFYLLLIIMVLTGLFLTFEDFFAPYKSIRHTVKNVHGFCMYLVLAFIAVHMVGVFLTERKDGKGIVSDIINGG